MKRVLTGSYSGLKVEGDMTVNGVVRGAYVPAGTGLTINGALAGHVVVEDDGELVVHGTFSPQQVNNEGTILVAGVAAVSPSDLDSLGRFGMSPGSLMDDNLVLEDDGSIRRVGGANLDIDAADWCVWLRDEQRFLPLGHLRGASAD